MGTLSFMLPLHVRPEAPLAALAYMPGLKPQRCAIVHYTKLGACVSSAAELPDMFIMRAVDSHIERICRVVWRDERLLGVEYVNARTMGRSRKKELPVDWGATALYST